MKLKELKQLDKYAPNERMTSLVGDLLAMNKVIGGVGLDLHVWPKYSSLLIHSYGDNYETGDTKGNYSLGIVYTVKPPNRKKPASPSMRQTFVPLPGLSAASFRATTSIKLWGEYYNITYDVWHRSGAVECYDLHPRYFSGWDSRDIKIVTKECLRIQRMLVDLTEDYGFKRDHRTKWGYSAL